MQHIKVKEQSDYDNSGNCAIQAKYEIFDPNNKKIEIYSYDAYYNNIRDLKIYDENDMLIIHYNNTDKNETYDFHHKILDQKFINAIFNIFEI